MNQATVLVVDDEPNVCNALQRLLQNRHLKVIMADSGETALSLIANNEIDVIVSDIQMPGIDGTELLSKVESPNTRRVVLTGFADTDRAIAAINQGAVNRYLTKPWNNTELRSVIDEEITEAHKLKNRKNKHNTMIADIDKLHDRMDVSTNLLNLTSEALASRQYDSLIQFGELMLRARCPIKAGLGKSVTIRTRKLAERLGLPQEQREQVLQAAALHRLGELVLPAEMVSRSFISMSRPDIDQYAIYPAFSASLVANEHHELADIVRQHRPHLISAPNSPANECAQILEIATEYEELCIFCQQNGSGVSFATDFIQSQRGQRYEDTLVEALIMDIT